ncbi:MAG: fibrobacter succinogenes major paralogous domain-containing protein [Fibromonadales bacterium]|nr:fibrobacter succinogenes major paralogous domain-containing protein [Fibromonadales bacterium]
MKFETILKIGLILIIGAIGVQTMVSCSSDNDPFDSSKNESQTYQYCVVSNAGWCLEGPFTASVCKDSEGMPSNNCPYEKVVASSSSSSRQSSSSVASSSSSFVPGSHFNPSITYGSLQDSRDGKTYKTVVIGTQTWMAENLNYNASGSVCYDNNANNCDTYGRLYDWNTAMNNASSSNAIPSGVQGVCPSSWHLPSDDEWEILVKYVDPSASGDYYNVAGTALKATSGWDSHDTYGNGTDDFGFAALPGGDGNSGRSFYGSGTFDDVGGSGTWWSATEYNASFAWNRYMDYSIRSVGRYNLSKGYLFSVRCVKY